MGRTPARRLVTPLTASDRAEVSRLWQKTSIESGRSMFQIGKLSTIVEAADTLFAATDTRRALLVGDLALWREYTEQGLLVSHHVIELLSQCIDQIDNAS